MLIVCPNCATSYDVDVASLRPNGRQVRCLRCASVWQAELPHAEKLAAAADALAPLRDAVEAMVAPVRHPVEATAEDAAAASAPAAPPAAEELDVAAVAAPDRPAPEPAFDAPAARSDAAESADSAASAPSLEAESPPLAPTDLDADRPPSEAAADQSSAPNDKPLEDIETVAARRYRLRAKRKGLHWPLSRLQSGILALIVANAIIVGWRADFVRAMPQTAGFFAWIGLPVNLRGLDFDKLTTATERHEGMPVLVVGGDIVNDTSKTVDVPHLRFAVRNAARQEIYSWTAVPSRAVLPPGETIEFHARLASPPPDAHDVLVRFVNRYDIMTGTR